MKKLFSKTIGALKNSKSILWTTILCFLASFLVVSFFVYSAMYSKILPNIWVDDLNIGGLSVKEASEKVSSGFEALDDDRSVILSFSGTEKIIKFSDIDLRLDSQKTAETAFSKGRTSGTLKKALTLFSLAFKKEGISPEFSLNRGAFEKIISELSSGKEIPPLDTTYTVSENQLTIIKGHSGKVVDRDKALDSLFEAFLDPNIKKIDLLLETLKETPIDLDKFYEELTSPVKNASYRMEDGNVVIDEEKAEITVEKALIKEALESDKEVYTLAVKAKLPDITKKQLEELLFKDTLASYSSSFATSTPERASNVILTANRIDGKILMPGEVFSYDAAIGKRTRANGYKEAGVYIGNKVESGIGGGICQTSSTLYSAALYANLEIVSRTSHSLPVAYVPAGQDATIAEGYIDLKIKNSTEYPIKISAAVSGRNLTCSILGVKEEGLEVQLSHVQTDYFTPEAERTENSSIPKGYIYVKSKGAPGYAIASQRIVKKDGKIIKTEKLTKSVYRAAPIEEEVNPLDKDTPSALLKSYTPGMKIPEDEPLEELPPSAPPEDVPSTPSEEDTSNAVDEDSTITPDLETAEEIF